MATRCIKQEIEKAKLLLPELDDAGFKALRRLVRMSDDLERAHATCTRLKVFSGDLKAFAEFLRGCDPTLSGKYLRWLLNRLNHQTEDHLFDIDFVDGGAAVKKALLAFSVKTQYLPLDQRDILSYLSLQEVNRVLAEHVKNFDTISYPLLDALDHEEVVNSTCVLECDDLRVCVPRSIEEASLLLCNDRWLDSRGKGFYRKLKGLGSIYIFLSGYGPQIAVLPHSSEERGVIYDSTGEFSIFEDALDNHQLDYETAPEIIELMCRIDPALAFDQEMTEIEPFLMALNQFPLILLEDRELDDAQAEKLLAHPGLSAAARNIIEEVRA